MNGDRRRERRRGLPRSRRIILSFVAVVAVSTIVLLVLAHYVNETRRLSHENAARIEDLRTVKLVLCAQRRHLARSVRRTEDILAERPGPFIFTIPRPLIVEGLKDDRQNLRALSLLNC